ncbi:MAG: hypothetical protein DRO93_10230 [Candidatus Thorarchaeota archaeon]|nr:MAG: hypothetical protein DRO93_10230 [Candidatus Thorarchaeota archaeon]
MACRIRQLIPEDYDRAYSYLNKEPLFNIHIIHGLQTHGLESERARFWGAFQGARLGGVLFTDALWADHRNSPRFGCLFGDDSEGLARLGRLSAKRGLKLLKGERSCIQAAAEGLASHVSRRHMKDWYLYKAEPERSPLCFDHPVRVATRG